MSSLMFGAAFYDREGASPILGYRYAAWRPGGPGIDMGIETRIFVNQLDLDLCYPIQMGRLTFTPRVGPTVCAGTFGGVTGLGMGGRIQFSEAAGNLGVVLDGMYRTFPEDDIDTAWPITSVSLGLTWRSTPRSR